MRAACRKTAPPRRTAIRTKKKGRTDKGNKGTEGQKTAARKPQGLKGKRKTKRGQMQKRFVPPCQKDVNERLLAERQNEIRNWVSRLGWAPFSFTLFVGFSRFFPSLLSSLPFLSPAVFSFFLSSFLPVSFFGIMILNPISFNFVLKNLVFFRKV